MSRRDAGRPLLRRLVGQAIAIVLVTPLNFVGNRLWSFRHRPRPDAAR